MQEWLDAGANLNVADESGVSAFFLASITPHPEAMKFLLEKEKEGNSKSKPSLIAKLFGKNSPTMVNGKDLFGIRPMYHVLKNRNLKALEFLIENGAHINQPTTKGRIALHFAARASCDEKIIKFLMVSGAKNRPDIYAQTPFDLALELNNLSAAKIILDHLSPKEQKPLRPIFDAKQKSVSKAQTVKTIGNPFASNPQSQSPAQSHQ
jgi:ankyrin repeat protein